MDIFNTLANAIRPQQPPKADVFILTHTFGEIFIGSTVYKKTSLPGKTPHFDMTTQMFTGEVHAEYDIPDNYLQPASKALSEKVHCFINQLESERADQDAERIDETNYYLTNNCE